jgi:hypothetical protein
MFGAIIFITGAVMTIDGGMSVGVKPLTMMKPS